MSVIDKYRITAYANGTKDVTEYRTSLDGAMVKAIQMAHDDRGQYRSPVRAVRLEGRRGNTWVTLSEYVPDRAATRLGGGPLRGTWVQVTEAARFIAALRDSAQRLLAEADEIEAASKAGVRPPVTA